MKNNRRVKNARGKIPPDVRKNFQLFLYKVLVRIWQDLLQCMERIVLGDGISGDPHAEFVVLQAGLDIRHRQFEQFVLSVEEHTDVLTPVGFRDTRYPHTPFVHGVAFYMWIGGCQGTSNPLIQSPAETQMGWRMCQDVLSLLLVTPCPVDPYDENLRRKPSPVRFDRNSCGEIILPGQWLLTKVEELAHNPALDEEQRVAALRFSRVAMVGDIVLPAEMQTLALSVPNTDGTTTVLEALPGGYILNMNGAG